MNFNFRTDVCFSDGEAEFKSVFDDSSMSAFVEPFNWLAFEAPEKSIFFITIFGIGGFEKREIGFVVLDPRLDFLHCHYSDVVGFGKFFSHRTPGVMSDVFQLIDGAAPDGVFFVVGAVGD